jgi:hypothetical protein
VSHRDCLFCDSQIRLTLCVFDSSISLTEVSAYTTCWINQQWLSPSTRSRPGSSRKPGHP